MSEIDILMESIKKDLQFREIHDRPFPLSNNYTSYVLDWILTHSQPKWCNKHGTGLYDLIQKEERPFGNYQDATLRDNGIYLFEDKNKRLIYVGKRAVHDLILNRVLDHVMPPHPKCPYANCITYPSSNAMQNTPEIWVNHLLKKEKIRILVYIGIKSYQGQTSAVESYIEKKIFSDCIRLFGHRPYYNKRIP